MLQSSWTPRPARSRLLTRQSPTTAYTSGTCTRRLCSSPRRWSCARSSTTHRTCRRRRPSTSLGSPRTWPGRRTRASCSPLRRPWPQTPSRPRKVCKRGISLEPLPFRPTPSRPRKVCKRGISLEPLPFRPTPSRPRKVCKRGISLEPLPFRPTLYAPRKSRTPLRVAGALRSTQGCWQQWVA